MLPDSIGKNRRKGFSLYLRSEKDRLNFRNRIEYRKEKGYEKVNQLLSTNTFTYRYSKEYTFAGKLNYSFTDDSYKYRFLESSVGLAYRPVMNDRINLLSRYTVLEDKDTKISKIGRAHV